MHYWSETRCQPDQTIRDNPTSRDRPIGLTARTAVIALVQAHEVVLDPIAVTVPAGMTPTVLATLVHETTIAFVDGCGRTVRTKLLIV